MPSIAVCQVGVRPLEPDRNVEQLTAMCNEAADQGADIVVLPELAISGYVLDRQRLLAVAEPADGDRVAALSATARQHGIVVVAGFAERVGDGLFNSAIVFDADGSMSALYRKLHLFGQEKHCFLPGDRGLPIARTRHGNLAVCICYDLRFPEVMRLAALRGADLMVVPTAWVPGFDATESPISAQAHGAILQANLNQIFVACASQSGQPGEFGFLGNSLIADPFGQVLAGPLDSTDETVATARVDWSSLVAARRRSDLITPRADRRTDVYGLRYESHDY